MIAFDSSSHQELESGSATIVSWSHTCTGSNISLVVFVYEQQTTSLPSSVTWGSQNLVNIDSLTSVPFGCSSVWILTSAHTGSDTISVNRGSNLPGPFFAQASSYTGTKSTQPDSHGNFTMPYNTGKTMTISTTVVSSNCWIIGGSMFTSNPTVGATWTSNVTDRGAFSYMPSGTLQYWWTLSDSNGIVNSGSQGITWTNNGAANNGGTNGGFVLSLAPFISTSVDNSLFFAGD